MNPENVIWIVKFSDKPVTFTNCLAVCNDPRTAAMARFIFRETSGEVMSRSECERLVFEEHGERYTRFM